MSAALEVDLELLLAALEADLELLLPDLDADLLVSDLLVSDLLGYRTTTENSAPGYAPGQPHGKPGPWTTRHNLATLIISGPSISLSNLPHEIYQFGSK